MCRSAGVKTAEKSFARLVTFPRPSRTEHLAAENRSSSKRTALQLTFLWAVFVLVKTNNSACSPLQIHFAHSRDRYAQIRKFMGRPCIGGAFGFASQTFEEVLFSWQLLEPVQGLNAPLPSLYQNFSFI